MEGSGHAGGGVVQAQLRTLAVFLGNVGGVVEDGLGQVVNRVIGSLRVNDQGCLYGNGGHIAVLSGIGAGGNHVGGVEGAGGHHGICHSAVNGNQVSGVGGAQLGDGRSGRTCHNKGRVDLAVLQRVGGIGKALVLGVDVGLSQAGGSQNIGGIEVYAGTGCADGNASALQIGNTLDAGIHGHQLNRLGIQARHNPEGINLTGGLKGAGALPGVGHNVGLNGAQLVVTGGDALNVGLGAIGGNHGHINAGLILNVLAQNTAVAVIGAGGSAGAHGHLRGGRAAGSQGKGQGSGQCQGKQLFHFLHCEFLLFVFG